MSFDPSRFDQIVFSGGGTRCFWHGGFMSLVGTFEDVAPARVSAISGGALSGAAWISGNDERCKRVMGAIFERNERDLRLDRDKLTDHEELYREAVRGTLPPEAIEAVADGPSFQILLASPPASMPTSLAVALGSTYKLEEAVTGSPRLKLPKSLGLEGLMVDARQAARDGRLVDLICAAATIPPVFDVPRWEGREVIDGGTLTKVAYPQPDRGETLVLMTSPYRNLPDEEGRTYAAPSREVEADKIDFTDREKIEQTWERGRLDARAFLRDQAESA